MTSPAGCLHPAVTSRGNWRETSPVWVEPGRFFIPICPLLTRGSVVLRSLCQHRIGRIVGKSTPESSSMGSDEA